MCTKRRYALFTFMALSVRVTAAVLRVWLKGRPYNPNPCNANHCRVLACAAQCYPAPHAWCTVLFHPACLHLALQDAKPAGRQEPLINGKMFKHIVAQGFYQIFWMFLFLYGLPRHFPQYAVHNDEEWLRVAGILFNTFIFAQIFNLINSRRIADEYNVFEGECCLRSR